MSGLRVLTDIDEQLCFDKLVDPKSNEALVAATVVDVQCLAVDGIAAIRMQGYMNRAAIEATLSDGIVTFFSRTTGKLWKKGETSGNILRLRGDIYVDCDGDSLLINAEPVGSTCHTGSQSCFELR
ncbi:phosphoribosyl-AMP cyclohydrolase [candidate division TM7 genomosp. GTL1]|nr:phosphoribosyl-AMP cyclohydrolase [candidate division TM7 genomosp. GTL1]